MESQLDADLERHVAELAKRPSLDNPALKYFSSTLSLFEIHSKEPNDDDTEWRSSLKIGDSLYAFHAPSRTWQRAQVNRLAEDMARVVYVGFDEKDSQWFRNTSKLLNNEIFVELDSEGWREFLVEGSRVDAFPNNVWTTGTVVTVLEDGFVIEADGIQFEVSRSSPHLMAEAGSKTGIRPRFSLLPSLALSRVQLQKSVLTLALQCAKVYQANFNADGLRKALDDKHDDSGELAFALIEAWANGLGVIFEDSFPKVMKDILLTAVARLPADKLRISLMSLEVIIHRSGILSDAKASDLIESLTLPSVLYQLLDPSTYHFDRLVASQVLTKAARCMKDDPPRDTALNMQLFLGQLERSGVFEAMLKDKALGSMVAKTMALLAPAMGRRGVELATALYIEFGDMTMLEAVDKEEVTSFILETDFLAHAQGQTLFVTLLSALRDNHDVGEGPNAWWESEDILLTVLSKAREICRSRDALVSFFEAFVTPSYFGRHHMLSDNIVEAVARTMFDTAMQNKDYVLACELIRFVGSLDVQLRRIVLGIIERGESADDLLHLLNILVVIWSQQGVERAELESLWRVRKTRPTQSLMIDDTLARLLEREMFEDDETISKRTKNGGNVQGSKDLLINFYKKLVIEAVSPSLSVPLRIRGYELTYTLDPQFCLEPGSYLPSLLNMVFADTDPPTLRETDLTIICEFISRYRLFEQALNTIEIEGSARPMITLRILKHLLDVADLRGTKGRRSHVSMCSGWQDITVLVTFPETSSRDDFEPLVSKRPNFVIKTKMGATVWDIKVRIALEQSLIVGKVSVTGLALQFESMVVADGPQNGFSLMQVASSHQQEYPVVISTKCFRLLPPASSREVLLASRVPPLLSAKAEAAITEIFNEYTNGREFLSPETFSKMSEDCTGNAIEVDTVRKLFTRRNVESTEGMTLDEFLANYASLAARTPGKVWKDLEALGFDHRTFQRPKQSQAPTNRMTFDMEEGLVGLQMMERPPDENNPNDAERTFRDVILERDDVYSHIFRYLEDDMLATLAWDLLMRLPTRPCLVLEVQSSPSTVLADYCKQRRLMLEYCIQIAEFILCQDSISENIKRRVISAMAAVHMELSSYPSIIKGLKRLSSADPIWTTPQITGFLQYAMRSLLESKGAENIWGEIVDLGLRAQCAHMVTKELLEGFITTTSEERFSRGVGTIISNAASKNKFSQIIVGTLESTLGSDSAQNFASRDASESSRLRRLAILSGHFRNSISYTVGTNAAQIALHMTIASAQPSRELILTLAQLAPNFLPDLADQCTAFDLVLKGWPLYQWSEISANELMGGLLTLNSSKLIEDLHRRTINHLEARTLDEPEGSVRRLVGSEPEVVAFLTQISALTSSNPSTSDTIKTVLDLFRFSTRMKIVIGASLPLRGLKAIDQFDLDQARRDACSFTVIVKDCCDACAAIREYEHTYHGPLRLILTHMNLEELFRKYQEETKVLDQCHKCKVVGSLRRSRTFSRCLSDALMIEFVPTEIHKAARIPLIREELVDQKLFENGGKRANILGLFKEAWTVAGVWYRSIGGSFHSCVRCADEEGMWDRYECRVGESVVERINEAAAYAIGNIGDPHVKMMGMTLRRPTATARHVPSGAPSQIVLDDELRLMEWKTMQLLPVVKVIKSSGQVSFAFAFAFMVRFNKQVFASVLDTYREDFKRLPWDGETATRVCYWLRSLDGETDSNLVELLLSLNTVQCAETVFREGFFMTTLYLLEDADTEMSQAMSILIVQNHPSIFSVLLAERATGLDLLICIMDTLQGQFAELFKVDESNIDAVLEGLQVANDAQKRSLCQLLGDPLSSALTDLILRREDVRAPAMKILVRYFERCHAIALAERFVLQMSTEEDYADVTPLAALVSCFYNVGQTPPTKSEGKGLAHALVTNPTLFEALCKRVVNVDEDWEVTRCILVTLASEPDEKMNRFREIIGCVLLRSFVSYKSDPKILLNLLKEIKPMSAGRNFEKSIFMNALSMKNSAEIINQIKTLRAIELMCDRLALSSRLVEQYASFEVPPDEDRASDWILRFLCRFLKESESLKDPESNSLIEATISCIHRWDAIEKNLDFHSGLRTFRFPHEKAEILVKVARAHQIEQTENMGVFLQLLSSTRSLMFWAINPTRNAGLVKVDFFRTDREKFELPDSMSAERYLLPGELGLIFEGMRVHRDSSSSDTSSAYNASRSRRSSDFSTKKARKLEWGNYSFNWIFLPGVLPQSDTALVDQGEVSAFNNHPMQNSEDVRPAILNDASFLGPASANHVPLRELNHMSPVGRIPSWDIQEGTLSPIGGDNENDRHDISGIIPVSAEEMSEIITSVPVQDISCINRLDSQEPSQVENAAQPRTFNLVDSSTVIPNQSIASSSTEGELEETNTSSTIVAGENNGDVSRTMVNLRELSLVSDREHSGNNPDESENSTFSAEDEEESQETVRQERDNISILNDASFLVMTEKTKAVKTGGSFARLSSISRALIHSGVLSSIENREHVQTTSMIVKREISRVLSLGGDESNDENNASPSKSTIRQEPSWLQETSRSTIKRLSPNKSALKNSLLQTVLAPDEEENDY